ncbi:response regulator [Flavihumibacter petaseus]|uniref:Putative two-component response regulator n=1 Tax=Flavihumibacter petaseus NBRC 106054 TaxID=1220578 RepID=A0A0E9N400_9BACT|nr:response regulator [Flavihumibacter petaseus]GAO44513.1 putative two-component response regulator [Flavihumibacter petaseus NBRC 106054]
MFKILLVDDDEDDRLLFMDAIQEIDTSITCDETVNGLEALAYLRTASKLPDVIFLDLNMPRMNGYEFLTALQQHDDLSGIPIVIITTSRIRSEQERTKQLGARHFFAKPDDYNRLKRDLQQILQDFR